MRWVKKIGRRVREWQQSLETARNQEPACILVCIWPPLSLSCVRAIASGIMHWLRYIEITKGTDAQPFPVHMVDVLGWSMTFRCIGTFSNYLSFLRNMCCALGHEPPPIGHPAVRRAMGGIAKRMQFSPRCAPPFCFGERAGSCISCQAETCYSEHDVAQHDVQRHGPISLGTLVAILHLASALAIRGKYMCIKWRPALWSCARRRCQSVSAQRSRKTEYISLPYGGRATRSA